MMYKVLLVDDEVIERQGLRKIIKDHFPTIEMEEAENGRKAILQAEQFSPDIVFMDIKMPGIDGIEAAEEIMKMHQTTKVIMVSAFDTFEYARQAMKIGVKQYLLKPSTTEEIKDALMQTIREIELAREKRNETLELKDNYRRALSIVQSKVITSLLVGDSEAKDELEGEEWLQLYDRRSFVMVLECLYGHSAEKLNAVDKKQMMTFIQTQLSRVFPKVYLGTFQMDQIPVLVQIGEDEKGVSIKSRTLIYGKELMEKAKRLMPHIRVTIGMGTPYDEIEQFVHSYHEALFALTQAPRDFMCVYYEQSNDEATYQTDVIYQLEKQLIDQVVTGKVDKVKEQYRLYMDELLVRCDGKIEKVKEHLLELVVLVSRKVHDMYPEILIQRSFLQSKSMLELQKGMYDEVKRVTQVIDSLHFSKSHDVIFRAQEYISKHYERAITLEEVAEKVELSPHYFSKVFKERCGQSFIDYVTKFRVEKAKDLMKSKKRNVKEICFDVGYKDPNYFSRVFKKVTGISPSDYRHQQISN